MSPLARDGRALGDAGGEQNPRDGDVRGGIAGYGQDAYRRRRPSAALSVAAAAITVAAVSAAVVTFARRRRRFVLLLSSFGEPQV